MPRILIVEDEPAAGRYLRSMIELNHPEFSVAGIAANGREALAELGRLRPELVITDVKMPVMDGIELVAELRRNYPSLPAVIVSGYQEFEYARKALDTGVVDYLLKPVDPARLAEVLKRLGALLSAREEAEEAEQLARCIKGDSPAPEGRFWMALSRCGGLPSRFRLDEAIEDGARGEGGFYILPGRDSRERIYLGRAESVAREAFEAAVLASARGRPFTTVLMLSGATHADGLREAARAACLDLDNLLVAGLSQVHRGAVARAPDPACDKTLADRVEFALGESRADLLEGSVRDLSEAWRAGGIPLVSVESQLRLILQLVLRKSPHADEAVAANLEFLLEDALAASGDFDRLSDSAWSLVARAAGVGNFESRDSDVPAFFRSITRYVEGRYSEPLSLASLSEAFRISSSYLSKLFRQHAGRSFGDFLQAIRIDAAKRLIRMSPDMPLKDVAERVGFNDPFYFSRVFKSVAGLPPSDYSRRDRTGPAGQEE
jgi:two-component system, response regulator YesN